MAVCRVTLLAVFVAMVAVSGCTSTAGIVAVVGDMENARGDFGHHFADGVAAALSGSPLRVVYVDDKDDPALAARQAQSLVVDPRLLAVVGHSASATTSAALGHYVRAAVPLIVPIATMDDLGSALGPVSSPSVFRLPPPNRIQARALVTHLKDASTAALIVAYQDDGAYSSSMERQLSSEWADDRTYYRFPLPPNSTDRYDDAITDIKLAVARFNIPADVPIAVVAALYYREAGDIFRAASTAAEELSRPLSRFGTDGALHPEIGLALKASLARDLVGVRFAFVGPTWQAFDPDKSIFARYRAVHGRPGHPQREDQPTTYETMWPSFIEFGFLAGTLVSQAVDRAGGAGTATKRTVTASLSGAPLQPALSHFVDFGFDTLRRSVVAEPVTFSITIHEVVSAQPGYRLDATWLKQIAAYSARDLRRP